MTSIEWLIKELEEQKLIKLDKLSTILFNKNFATRYELIIEQAKEMHKQEIIDAFEKGEQEEYQNNYEIVDGERHYIYDNAENYYQQTFVSKGSDDHISDISKMVEDNVEKLQQDAWDNYEHEEGNLYSTTFRNAFKLGYNKAKETLLSEKRDIEYLKRESYRQGFLEAKETLYTKEQTLEFAKWLACNWIPLHVTKEYLWEYDELDLSKIPENYRGYKTEKQLFDIFQSLKQPKKD